MSIVDSVLEKTRDLKNQYDEHKRAAREDSLSIKEDELKKRIGDVDAKERMLKDLESSLVKKEKQLAQTAKYPFYVFLAMLSLGALGINYVLSHYDFTRRPRSESVAVEKSGTSAASEPASAWGTHENIQRAYDGVDATRGNFDVGAYCLEQEKRRLMSFEQCLSIAAAKIVKENR